MQEVWGALRMMQALYPSLVSFVKQLDFGDYGVGQQRKRCIAGSPALIARILNDESLHARAPTMRELLPNPPEGAEQVKASTGKCPDPEQTVENEDGTFTNPTIYHKCYRTLDEVAFSCVAAHPHYWATADFVTIQPFSAREQALLQSFPADYVLPTVKVHSNLGTGNAIPPLFIRKLMS
jgi:site-specific DNA-cytosine methylase